MRQASSVSGGRRAHLTSFCELNAWRSHGNPTRLGSLHSLNIESTHLCKYRGPCFKIAENTVLPKLLFKRTKIQVNLKNHALRIQKTAEVNRKRGPPTHVPSESHQKKELVETLRLYSQRSVLRSLLRMSPPSGFGSSRNLHSLNDSSNVVLRAANRTGTKTIRNTHNQLTPV